jgi:hypothetical protein
MSIGISNFGWKRMKNGVNCQHLLFTETERHSKFGCNLSKIYGEKPPRAFVKVVEGSEIYNFPIHHYVHFYSNFWIFKRANRGATTQGRASRRRATPCRDVKHRAPRRTYAAPASASAPHAHLPKAASRLPNTPRP